ncbi:unnamed protein product [Ectocarpus sp. 4 AP-2014]
MLFLPSPGLSVSSRYACLSRSDLSTIHRTPKSDDSIRCHRFVVSATVLCVAKIHADRAGIDRKTRRSLCETVSSRYCRLNSVTARSSTNGIVRHRQNTQ